MEEWKQDLPAGKAPQVFLSDPVSIKWISRLLEAGEVVALPTETVYGLAADAWNPLAVQRIFLIKGRPATNPLIAHVASMELAERCVVMNPLAEKLAARFWPGALTLVLPRRECIPDIVTAGLPTLGIRMPKHPAMRLVLESLGRPLAAPSANPSNYLSPTRVEHVIHGLGSRVQYILDGGPCQAGVESTIVDVSDQGMLRLLRPGPIPVAEMEDCVGMRIFPMIPSPGLSKDSMKSPGQMEVHYSPNTPLFIDRFGMQPVRWARVVVDGTLSVGLEDTDQFSASVTCCLSPSGEPAEAEQRLYSVLQDLDRAGFDAILVQGLPAEERWDAIRDRLTRAAARHQV
jgi:L-threonylcarbamoyladenylate synthase